MNLDDLNEAIAEARQTIRLADLRVGQLARMCAGRLRVSRVDHDVLCDLKRELARYNMHTGRWSDD